MQGKTTKVFGKFYTVRYENGSINCVLRGKLKQDKSLQGFSNPVAVGDFVDFEIDEHKTGVINSVHKRKNFFSRKDRANRKKDIFAANLDQIIILQSFKNPSFNLRFVDRISVRCKQENISAVLCVNKLDISSEKDLDYIRKYYKNTFIKIIFISVKENKNIDALREIAQNKRSFLIGNSGVGKSSLLNCIYPESDIKTSYVSDKTGKGRHTTTNVQLIEIDEHTDIIDSPGIREFGLMDIEPNELSDYFYEFSEFSPMCKFSPCTHEHEPHCEVKSQVEKGVIFKDRYTSYLQIYESVESYYKNKYNGTK